MCVYAPQGNNMNANDQATINEMKRGRIFAKINPVK